MARIYKKEIILPNGKKFLKDVKYVPFKRRSYNSTPAHFSIELPEEVKVHSSQEFATGSTESEAENEFTKLLQEWAKAAKSVKRYIVIKLKTKKFDTSYNFHFQHDNEFKILFNWGI